MEEKELEELEKWEERERQIKKEHGLVWFYNSKGRIGKCPKLQEQLEEPYKIVKYLNNLVFRIKRGQ